MNKFAIVAGFGILIAFGSGCATTDVVRDGKTYTAEIVASLLRQNAAAKELKVAAIASKELGDNKACERYARPALLIEAKAQAQAYRALWLAGLPYPKADGSIPEDGEEQDDPGVAPSPEPVSTLCGE